jgi:hypothetical protein
MMDEQTCEMDAMEALQVSILDPELMLSNIFNASIQLLLK